MSKTAECGFLTVPGGADPVELLTTVGPTLMVDIGFDPNFKIGIIPAAGITNVKALVDSGAGESCIDSLLAAQLNLPVVDRREISGAGGRQEVNMHLAQVHVPALTWTIYGVFAGVHLSAGGQVHQALIGRTFLRNFVMTYNGLTGQVTISK
jgi:hypothetical protein